MKYEQIESFFEEIYYSNKKNKRKKIIKYKKEDLVNFFKLDSEEEIEMLKLIISNTRIEFYDENKQIVKIKLFFEEGS